MSSVTCRACARREREIQRLEKELAAVGRKASNSDIREIYEFWLKETGREPELYVLTEGRRRKIATRLREGYSVLQLKHAIAGAAVAGYRSPDGVRYDDLPTILQSPEKVDLNLERYEATIGRNLRRDKGRTRLRDRLVGGV